MRKNTDDECRKLIDAANHSIYSVYVCAWSYMVLLCIKRLQFIDWPCTLVNILQVCWRAKQFCFPVLFIRVANHSTLRVGQVTKHLLTREAVLCYCPLENVLQIDRRCKSVGFSYGYECGYQTFAPIDAFRQLTGFGWATWVCHVCALARTHFHTYAYTHQHPYVGWELRDWDCRKHV